MNKINKILKWNTQTFIKALLGALIFSLSINIFIAPENLYNGGILGLSQLIERILKYIIHIKINFNVSGILYYLINIPLFVIAYKKISKTFFARTLFIVTVESILLSIIPVPKTQIVDDILVNVLMGAILAGVGIGTILSTSASAGGTDILGVMLTRKNKNYSVGKLNTSINLFIYLIAGIMFGKEIMIYSIIYSVISSLVTDKMHIQNINSNAFIFTKNNPKKIIEFIKTELNRDATYWDAKGGYNHTKTYIIYIVLSKYELQRLERHIDKLDKHAFIVKKDDVDVKGNFNKNL